MLLFTSGTTGEPKAAVLRHMNLASYLVGSLEFGSAGENEAAITSVPPYHIAAVSSVLSTTYVGRHVVQLESFDPKLWVEMVREESVTTHTMVVPTMLNRILDTIEADGLGLPSMRSLAYGGGPMPRPVVERALDMLRDVDLVNAYGLTETSSTIAVLGPEDHRSAFASTDPGVRARLGSVGHVLPGVELTVRNEMGDAVAPGATGEIWVRGEQVSGEYLGRGASSEDGWFNTRDAGYVDSEGYLFVRGRLDDVIVRGGENLSPGEIEQVLVEHPAVEAAAVVGIPDVEWGERVVAAVVLAPSASATEASSATTCASCSARHGHPSASRSAPSSLSRRRASCCGQCCASSWPRRSSDRSDHEFADVAALAPSLICQFGAHEASFAASHAAAAKCLVSLRSSTS